MSPQPDKDDDRSALSWETVLDVGPTDTAMPPPGHVTAPPTPVAPSPSAATSVEDEIEFTIPPLSMAPLSLNPLPPIPESPTPGPSSDHGDVLGDIHLEIPPLDMNGTPPPPRAATVVAPAPIPAPVSAPAPAPPAQPVVEAPIETPVFEMVDLHIAPLDVPPPAPSAQSPIAAAAPIPPVAPVAIPASVQWQPIETLTTPADAPPVATPVPVADPDPIPAPAPVAPLPVAATPVAPAPAATTAPPAQPVAEPVVDSAPSAVAPAAAPPAAMQGLPNDPVSHDATPTTVLDDVVAAHATPPAVDVAETDAPVAAVAPMTLPNYQPRQAAQPAVATASSAASIADPASRKERKHDQKLKKLQQKQALQDLKAKSKPPRSGGGGVALFFTLMVLTGLIAGAIVFGKPYLFPDEWDAASRPYGDAVEIALGTDIAEPLVVQRQLTPLFTGPMSDQLIGPWEDEMATWRSLGLVSGTVDATLLHTLTADWTAAYYSPATGEIIANDSVPVAVLDAAIVQAMAAGALDQEIGWSASIDDSQLDASALTRANIIAASRAAGAASSYGAADTSDRDIGVSTFLPPVLEFRVNAPDYYAEFANGNERALNALATSVQLQSSGEPELVAGDVLGTSQVVTDRTFWYLVFASYTDAATAYAASNSLVQASLATADSAGTQCMYATFSGTDVAGTGQVANVLQQWATNAPAAMNASVSTLSNGTMQLRSCDPGVGAESGARFGIGREIARFRSIELAAVTALESSATAEDMAAAISEVRASVGGLELPDVDFASTPAEAAAQARTLVSTLSTGE